MPCVLFHHTFCLFAHTCPSIGETQLMCLVFPWHDRHYFVIVFGEYSCIVTMFFITLKAIRYVSLSSSPKRRPALILGS